MFITSHQSGKALSDPGGVNSANPGKSEKAGTSTLQIIFL